MEILGLALVSHRDKSTAPAGKQSNCIAAGKAACSFSRLSAHTVGSKKRTFPAFAENKRSRRTLVSLHFGVVLLQEAAVHFQKRQNEINIFICRSLMQHNSTLSSETLLALLCNFDGC